MPKRFAKQYKHGKVNLSDDWSNKTIWIGYPGSAKMEEVTKKILKQQFKELWLVVPDLCFERWFTQIHDIPASRWGGSDMGDVVWEDPDGNPTGTELYTWWLIRIPGQH